MSPCETNYLEIYEGMDDTGTLIGKYCEDNIPPTAFKSVGDVLFFKMVKTLDSGNGFTASRQTVGDGKLFNL